MGRPFHRFRETLRETSPYHPFCLSSHLVSLADLASVDLDHADPGYIPDGKAAPRWQPDMQLVPAILLTPRWPRHLTDYDEPDRCWIIAGVDLAGWSANEIEDRIGGSIRLIRDLRSRPFTELCKLMQTEITRLETDLRVEQISHAATQNALAGETRVCERLRTQRDQILRAQRKSGGQVELFPCGCPKVEHNIYRNRGREHCRECGRERLARYRQRHVRPGQNRPVTQGA